MENNHELEEVDNKKRKKEKKSKKHKKEKAQVENTQNDQTTIEEEPVVEVTNAENGQNDIVNGDGRKHKKKKHKRENSTNQSEQNGSETHAQNEDSFEKAKLFRQENSITLSGRDIEKFNPVESFATSPFSKELLVGCKNFTKPTPIQAQCWPIITSGRDVVAIAETGSGKTLAFSLPVLQHIKDNCMNTKLVGKKARPYALVLSPTRELAMQIAEVCVECADHIGIKTVCLYGGVAKGSQAYELSKKVSVVVATPGRLLDLLNDGALSIEDVSFLVLDEADRMLDLGFEKDIRRIISQIPPKDKRRTLMFSATWPQSIQNLANEFLNDPVKVTIGSEDLSANHRVTQIVEVIAPFDKDKRLEALLKEYHKSRKNKILIFALYKKEASRIEEVLSRRGWKAQAIHGDKSQVQRTQALGSFKDGSVPLLIATDVAARGLDIPDVEYVINYTFPLTIEDYVHRIGRTGRAGKVGISHTFFTDYDKAHAGALMNVLREANQTVPEELTKYGSHVKKKEHGLYGAFFKEVNTTAKAKVKKFDSED